MATRDRERLTALLRTLATTEGYTPSAMPGVQFLRASYSSPRTPVVYEPNIFILGQGRKTGYLRDQRFVYDAHNYLVLPVPLPFECKTDAAPDGPLLGVSIGVDPVVVGELLLEMDDRAGVPGSVRGVYASPLTDELTDATVRLLDCLSSPVESRILAPGIVREILYRVLRGEQSAALRAVATRHSHVSQINRALRRIHRDYARTLDVETLARDAGMSVSTFHATFKTVTSTSPLQYLKSIRLHKARALMVQDGYTAGIAARKVGYESPSQFSREFKRFFGGPPTEQAAKARLVGADGSGTP